MTEPVVDRLTAALWSLHTHLFRVECEDEADGLLAVLPAHGLRLVEADESDALAEARRTIEAMSGDAADLHDLIGEAAAMRSVLGHLLGERGRIHDSGCGICDAGRALLTAEHELPSWPSAPIALRAAADKLGEAIG